MTLTIHPSNLPDGAVGFAYDSALAGTGGHEPYEFSLSRGVLPPGLTLVEAILSGTATLPGTFSFTLSMTDAAMAIQSRSYVINILPVTPTIVVEDGTIVEGANSYLGLLDLYFNQSNLGLSGTDLATLQKFNPTTQTNMLIWATAYVERRFRFYGQTLDPTQPLQWPRTKNYDIRGFPIDPGTIPIQLQQGIAFLVAAAAANPRLMVAENTAFPTGEQAWSMDGVSITYPQSSNTTLGVQEGMAIPLFEQRLPDLEVLLRSIGELKAMDWVTTDRQTVVNR